MVSSPTVVVDETLAARLGGPALVKMAVPSLENLLNNSGRFTVLMDREAPYKIKATITSLKISQTSAKKGAAAADVFKTLVPKLAGKNKIDPELAGLMTADWSKDEVVMNVECAISIQVMDKDSRLIVGNTGVVSRERTTAAIRGELGGITFGNGITSSAGTAQPSSLDLDFPSKLIELAAYESLKQSIAAIDRELLQRKAVASKEPQFASQTSENKGSAAAGEAPSTGSKGKFCGECGQSVGVGCKFCTACGKALRN